MVNAACTGLPDLPMRMRLVLFGRRVTPCAPSFLVKRIDRGELRLNHFADKLAKGPSRFPAKRLANLVRATHEPSRFYRAIKSRIMLHVFPPWKIDNGESRFDEFAH